MATVKAHRYRSGELCLDVDTGDQGQIVDSTDDTVTVFWATGRATVEAIPPARCECGNPFALCHPEA